MAHKRDKFGTPIANFLFAVSNSEVESYSNIHKFGANSAVTTSKQTLWTGTNSLYVWPGSAQYMKVSATN